MTRLTRTLVVVVACLALSPALWADTRGNFNVILGARQFGDTDMWDPVDQQFTLGVDFDFGLQHWPVNWAWGLFSSSGDNNIALPGGAGSIKYKLDTLELSTGVNKYWGKKFKFYLGGGFSFINADVTGTNDTTVPDTSSDDDFSVGLYANVGIYWRVGKLFNVGVDGRFLGGTDMEIKGQSTNVDYGQVGLILGWGW